MYLLESTTYTDSLSCEVDLFESFEDYLRLYQGFREKSLIIYYNFIYRLVRKSKTTYNYSHISASVNTFYSLNNLRIPNIYTVLKLVIMEAAIIIRDGNLLIVIISP